MIDMEILARAQMEKAFGELRTMVQMNYKPENPERYREMKKKVEDFIQDMEFNFG